MKKFLITVLTLCCLFSFASCFNSSNKETINYTLIVSCDEILKNLNNTEYSINPEKIEILPSNGIILNVESKCSQGNTARDVLIKNLKEHKMHYIDSSGYIEAICNIYSGDCGAYSGWMFYVNGNLAEFGAAETPVNSGDVIEFKYVVNYNLLFNSPNSNSSPSPSNNNSIVFSNNDIAKAVSKATNKELNQITANDANSIESLALYIDTDLLSGKNSNEHNNLIIMYTSGYQSKYNELTTDGNISNDDQQILNDYIVNVNAENIDIMSDLQYFNNLTELTFYNYGKSNVTLNFNLISSKNMPKLEKLLVYKFKTLNFNNIESFTSLKNLTVVDDTIEDISAVAKLTNLEVLALAGKKITDATAVENLENLQTLSIADTSLETVPSLKNLKKLEMLDLMNNNLRDISSLGTLDNNIIQEVYLIGNTEIKDYSPICHIDENKIFSEE